MRGFAEQKVIGGKLLKARVDFSERIKAVSFFGDFFLHPEDTIGLLEQSIVGTQLPQSLSEITGRFEAILISNKAELVGATPSDLARVVLEAIQNGK